MRQGKKNKSNYKIALKLNSAQLMNQYMSPVEIIIVQEYLQVSSYMDLCRKITPSGRNFQLLSRGETGRKRDW